MTVIARRIGSTPTRTATQTWDRIVLLLAPALGSAARAELAKASGVACMSIASEAIKDAPIVVWGSGPRVRIYGVFGEDAITGDSINEDGLVSTPTDGDWRMSIPCTPEDAAWCRKRLGELSRRIAARSLDEDVDDGDRADAAPAAAALSIDVGEFLKS
jgi:hypothetical protein